MKLEARTQVCPFARDSVCQWARAHHRSRQLARGYELMLAGAGLETVSSLACHSFGGPRARLGGGESHANNGYIQLLNTYSRVLLPARARLHLPLALARFSCMQQLIIIFFLYNEIQIAFLFYTQIPVKTPHIHQHRLDAFRAPNLCLRMSLRPT